MTGKSRGYGYLTLIFLGLIGLSSQSFAVIETRVLLPKKLDFVTLEVNGVERRVRAEQEIVIVRGDVVKVVDAKLRDPDSKIDFLNVVGYRSVRRPNSPDDRGETLYSHKDLLAEWSVNKRGELFNIKAVSDKKLRGKITLRVVPPELRYFVIQVNGKDRYVRPGQTLEVQDKDALKVTNVTTNIENQDDSVKFRILPIEESGKIHSSKYYEVQFSRNGQVFAKIPMRVKGT